MTARDRWTVDLKCVPCGTSDIARVSQADGWSFEIDQSTRIDHTPDGFKGKENQDGTISFFCDKCDKEV